MLKLICSELGKSLKLSGPAIFMNVWIYSSGAEPSSGNLGRKV